MWWEGDGKEEEEEEGSDSVFTVRRAGASREELHVCGKRERCMGIVSV